MDFSSKNKDFLAQLAEKLELEVEAQGRKPTKDELIVALEAADPDLVAIALAEMGVIEADDADEEVDNEPEVDAPESVDTVEHDTAVKGKKKYGYKKGDKDPTTYDVGDPMFGHIDGPRHKEWMKVNG